MMPAFTRHGICVCLGFLLALPGCPVHADAVDAPAEVEAGCRELAGKIPGRDTCLCTYTAEGRAEDDPEPDPLYGFVSKDGRYFCMSMPWHPDLGDSDYLDRLSAAVSEVDNATVRYFVLAGLEPGGGNQDAQAPAADSGGAGTDAGGDVPPEGGGADGSGRADPKAGEGEQDGQAVAADSGGGGTDAGEGGPPEDGKSVDGGDWNSRSIKVLQWSLRRCGYDVAMDGIHGPGMRAAMRRFLRDSGMPEADMGLSEFHSKINRVSGDGVPNFSCPGEAGKPSRAADLSGQDLSGAKLPNTDFSNADLSKSNMERADLENSNFSGANLAGASLRGANLKGANLKGADLTGANLEGLNLTDAVADGAKMVNAKLRGVAAAGASLKNAVLDGADLLDTDMRKTIMTGVRLKRAAILGMRFAERTGIGLSALIAAAPAYPAALAGRITKELTDKGLEKLGKAADKVLTVGRDGEGSFRVIGVRQVDRCSRFNAETGECAD